jgi:polyphosphate kinase
MSSADWMGRNLVRRVETLIEIQNPTVKAQIVGQIMAANLADEAQSWILRPEGPALRTCPPMAKAAACSTATAFSWKTRLCPVVDRRGRMMCRN